MRGYSVIGLYHPKSSINVGSALRAAGCYGAAAVFAEGCRYHKASTDTCGIHRHMPLLEVPSLMDAIPYDCVPVAVDLVPGATPLHEYKHPERAFYVFGPEDGTLGERVLSRCRDRVYVPTFGCMNLAATVNVVLYARGSQRGFLARPEGVDHE